MEIEIIGVSYQQAADYFDKESGLTDQQFDDLAFNIDDGGYYDADGGDMRRYVVITFYNDDDMFEDMVVDLAEDLSDQYGGDLLIY